MKPKQKPRLISATCIDCGVTRQVQRSGRGSAPQRCKTCSLARGRKMFNPGPRDKQK